MTKQQKIEMYSMVAECIYTHASVNVPLNKCCIDTISKIVHDLSIAFEDFDENFDGEEFYLACFGWA